jgi:hypothetical protein
MSDKFDEMIKKAAKAHPKKQGERTPEYILSTYWEKGKELRGWIGRCTGVKLETGDKGKETEAFEIEWGTDEKPLCYTKMDWLTEKGDEHPRAMKHWHLKKGIFKAFTLENEKDSKGKYHLFAVSNGERTDLSVEAAFSILEDGVPE